MDDASEANLEVARDSLRPLFSEENQNLWYICYPPVGYYATTPASLPKPLKSFLVRGINGLHQDFKTELLSIIQHIGKSIDATFTSPGPALLSDSSYWRTFFDTLTFKMSRGLFVTHREKSEIEVFHGLLQPLLVHTAEAASLNLTPTDGFRSSSAYEESWTHKDKPREYITMSGYNNKDEICCIPVEARKCLTTEDIAGVAEYMSTKIQNGRYIHALSNLGILLEESHVRFAFSVIGAAGMEEDSITQLPVVLVSPPLAWRMGTSLNHLLIMALSTLKNLRIEKCVADDRKWQRFLGGDVWKEAKEVSKKNILANKLNTELKKLKEEVEALKESVAEEKLKLSRQEMGAMEESGEEED